MSGQKAFRVVRRIPITTYREEVLLETDDWLAAHDLDQRLAYDRERRVVGTHPSHKWGADGRCTACSARDNGSYGSHAPCGHQHLGSLLQQVEQWREVQS